MRSLQFPGAPSSTLECIWTCDLPSLLAEEKSDLPTELEEVLGQLVSCSANSGVLEGNQRWHYQALFALRFPLRYKRAAAAGVVASADAVRQHLAKLARGQIWHHVYARVRRFVWARRKVVSWYRQCKEERTTMLESWLKYWCDCEDRPQQRLRLRFLEEPPRKARDKHIPITDDELKVYVLWDLYWLLRLQHNVDLQAHHNDLLALRRQLAIARQKEQPTAPILARLFVKFLQAPRFPREAGTEIAFPHLLHLSQNVSPKAGATGQSAPSMMCSCPGHQTYVAFLSSPLCTRPEWLQDRHELPLTIIPPQRWIPASFATIHERSPTAVPRLPSCHGTQRASVVGDTPRALVKSLSFNPGSSTAALLKRRLATPTEPDSPTEMSPRLHRLPTMPNLMRPLPRTLSNMPKSHAHNASFSHSPRSSRSQHSPSTSIPLAPRRSELQLLPKGTALPTHRGKSFHVLEPLGLREA